MNGTKYLLDTNIILFVVFGDKTISDFLHLKDIYISVITEIELFGFRKLSQKEENEIKELIAEFRLIQLDNAVKNETILLRKTYNLKLPDCIIAATAITWNLTLVSADKQFKQIKKLALEIYEP